MTRKSKKNILLNIFPILLITAAIPVSLFLLNQKTSFFGKAYMELTGLKANLVVDMKSTNSISPNWNYLSQGGESKDGMLSSAVPSLKKIHPVYIRIDHIYDYYDPVERSGDGKLVFNWTKLDNQIQIIRATGARPFISLSYMPKAISSGSETDLPNSWEEYRFVVQKTIEHISGKGGLALSGIYYEVWNEPDLFGKFEIGKNKDYLKLYFYAEKGSEEAKNVLPFKIGGPATTGFYSAWFTQLFDYAAKFNLRLDFYSWHRYSLDIGDYVTDHKNAKNLLAKYPKYANSQLIITESGFNSEIDSRFDTSFSAFHSLAMISSLFGKVPMVFSFEAQDGVGPQMYWGRWGLLTNDKYGIPVEKPRFNAFEFLNRMKGQGIEVNGQGTWVKAMASVSNNTFRLLIVNYDAFGSHSEDAHFTILHIPYQKFYYRRFDFNGKITTSFVNIPGDSWSNSEKFGPNSAAIFEISPAQ